MINYIILIGIGILMYTFHRFKSTNEGLYLQIGDKTKVRLIRGKRK